MGGGPFTEGCWARMPVGGQAQGTSPMKVNHPEAPGPLMLQADSSLATLQAPGEWPVPFGSALLEAKLFGRHCEWRPCSPPTCSPGKVSTLQPVSALGGRGEPSCVTHGHGANAKGGDSPSRGLSGWPGYGTA